MHSYNALGSNDAYGSAYGTGDFYTDSTAQWAFDDRLKYILNHNHSTLGTLWKELSD
ncbi:hypothetical protein SCP_0704950 [Sparassis crispa]|uniref:Uncharacterized protein n=1 Tax=Sparassis crispa TaxID=139825 RepID=A0A401GSU4_9APHY|nr:hypothetical protein SCP_0704950 [Sparassis crispa]GBE85308.1 hypothetical protein SCP_0704950 [Sparassis crispa]